MNQPTPVTAEAPFAVSDYVQVACMGHYSVRIDVASQDVTGTIVVHGGQLWAAATATLRGVAALKRLAFAPRAAVLCATAEPRAVGTRNLPNLPWEQVLLDAARDHDEVHHSTRAAAPQPVADDETIDLGSLDSAPNWPRPPRAPAEPPVDRPPFPHEDAFALELERGADSLLHKDYASALRAYERAQELRPGDRLVQANVQRLAQLIARSKDHP